MQIEKVCRQESKIVLPQRPRGTYADKFRTNQLVSNHFKVNFRGTTCIYVVNSKFDPPISDDNRTLRNKIFKSFENKIKLIVPDPVYSGMNLMTCYRPNFDKETEIKATYEDKEYTLKLKIVKEIDYSKKEDKNIKFQELTFLNNCLRNFLRQLNFCEIGKSRKFFDTSRKTVIQNTNLKLFEGYAANFCYLESGLYLKVDIANKIVRAESVLQHIDNMYSIHETKSRDEKRAILRESLVGKSVMSNYGTSRYWRILDLEFDTNVDTKMLNETTSMADYYKRRYGISINKPRQPLLKVEDKNADRQTLLVPELCLMTGLSDDFDEKKRKEISRYTIRPAGERKDKIEDLIKRLNTETKDLTPKVLAERFGITIEDRLHKINAKTIPMPSLYLGEKQQIEEGRQSNFRLFDKPLYSTKVPLKVVCIYYKDTDVSSLERIFKSTARSFKNELEIKLVDLGEFSSRKGADTIIDELKYRAKKECFNIYLIILPNALRSSYKAIKRYCLLDLKIVSQVMTQASLQKKEFQSIATKVLLQMIAKVGNILWVPRTPELKSKVMMIGVDSCKDVQSKKKIIGFCATINDTFTKFHSSTVAQDSNSTVLEKMRELILKSINVFAQENGSAPDDVILLRDGCGSGQIRAIMETEVKECVEALEQYKEKSIGLTYLIIDKKVTQKFFSMNNGVCNPGAGSLVSSDLVSPDYDFYLVSQFVNRGTTVPTYYKVLYANSKLEEGKLQELLYSQCYNYVNWTGSIKIPAPVQYAKKMCAFVSQYINENVSELGSRLYYI